MIGVSPLFTSSTSPPIASLAVRPERVLVEFAGAIEILDRDHRGCVALCRAWSFSSFAGGTKRTVPEQLLFRRCDGSPERRSRSTRCSSSSHRVSSCTGHETAISASPARRRLPRRRSGLRQAGPRQGPRQDQGRQRQGRQPWRHGYGYGGCPPGLAKKSNGCMPPGQARSITTSASATPQLRQSVVLQPDSVRPAQSLRLRPDARYYYRDGYLYRVNPRTMLVQQVVSATAALSPGLGPIRAARRLSLPARPFPF